MTTSEPQTPVPSDDPILRRKSYATVTLTVQEKCHRYETRIDYKRMLIFSMTPVCVALGAWTLSEVHIVKDDTFSTVLLTGLGTSLSLAGLWFAYLALWQKSVLLLTPEKFALSIRGMIPIHRSGTRTWTPDELSAVTLDVTPMPARTRPVLTTSIWLAFAGADYYERTFFVFETPQEAEELRGDIIDSAAEMIERYNARREGRTPDL
jgi:hypothetical protein